MLSTEIDVVGERLLLHPYGALYWPRLRWLVASDLHLGKAAHLRKGGSAIPEGHDEATLDRLAQVLAAFRPDRLLILGDLFHSSHNKRWEAFSQWALQCPVPIHLVPGNHDVLADRRYAEAGVQVCDDTIEEGPFVLSHEPLNRPGVYGISGHLHPGVVLLGKGRQHMRLSCFWFGVDQAILPAFGKATGLHIVHPLPGDRVYARTDHAVIDVSSAMGGHIGTKRSR